MCQAASNIVSGAWAASGLCGLSFTSDILLKDSGLCKTTITGNLCSMSFYRMVAVGNAGLDGAPER